MNERKKKKKICKNYGSSDIIFYLAFCLTNVVRHEFILQTWANAWVCVCLVWYALKTLDLFTHAVNKSAYTPKNRKWNVLLHILKKINKKFQQNGWIDLQTAWVVMINIVFLWSQLWCCALVFAAAATDEETLSLFCISTMNQVLCGFTC